MQDKLYETIKAGTAGCKLTYRTDHLSQLLVEDPVG